MVKILYLSSIFVLLETASLGECASVFKCETKIFCMAQSTCVICVRLENTSTIPTRVTAWSDEAILAEPTGDAWLPKDTVSFGPKREGCNTYEFSSNEVRYYFINLHKSFIVPATKTKISFTAKFRRDELIVDHSRSEIIADFSEIIEIAPAPREKSSTHTFVKSVTEFGKLLSTTNQIIFFQECLLSTSVKEYLPLAEFIITKNNSPRIPEIIFWIFENSSVEKFDGLLERIGLTEWNFYATFWVECLHVHSATVPISKRRYSLILNSKNLPARLIAIVYMPDKFDAETKRDAISQATAWKSTLNQEDIAKLVDSLADPSFRQREFATFRLRGFGGRALAALEKFYTAAADPEVRTRLNSIIKQIQADPPTQDELNLVSVLINHSGNAKARIDILTALAKNSRQEHISTLASKGLIDVLKSSR